MLERTNCMNVTRETRETGRFTCEKYCRTGITRPTRNDTWSRLRFGYYNDNNVVTSPVIADHYHVSRLLNFFVTTLPMSMPSRSTIRCAKSGCEVPLKTLMFGILLCRALSREFSKFARNKLLARTGCDTGITETETTERSANR